MRTSFTAAMHASRGTPAPQWLALALAACFASAHAAPNYVMTDLSPITDDPTGLTYGTVLGMNSPQRINNKGQILGTGYPVATPYNSAGSTLLYDPLTKLYSNLAALPDGSSFVGRDLNANGQLLGTLTSPAGAASLVILNPDGSSLPVSPGVTSVSAFNNSGQIVGQLAGTASPCIPYTQAETHAMRSGPSGAGWQGLGTLTTGVDLTRGLGINSSGQVVGSGVLGLQCYYTDVYHAFVSTPTGLKDLHANTMFGYVSQAIRINDAGIAVGSFHAATRPLAGRSTPGGAKVFHATVWDTATGSYKDLGSQTNIATTSTLTAINNAGVVVGSESTYSGVMVYNWFEGTVAGSTHALVGDAATATLSDVNPLITNRPTGWIVASAIDVNDGGQILATAYDTLNRVHGILLTPTSAAVPPSVPNAPSGLVSSAVAGRTINLSWFDNAGNETGFVIERAVWGNTLGAFKQVATVPANTTGYADKKVPMVNFPTSYMYRIKAINAQGSSAYVRTVGGVYPLP